MKNTNKEKVSPAISKKCSAKTGSEIYRIDNYDNNYYILNCIFAKVYILNKSRFKIFRSKEGVVVIVDTHATIATNEKDRFERRVQRTLCLLRFSFSIFEQSLKMQGSSSIETGGGTFSVLVLLLGDSLLSLEESLSALIELQRGNEAVRGVNGDLALLT